MSEAWTLAMRRVLNTINTRRNTQRKRMAHGGWQRRLESIANVLRQDRRSVGTVRARPKHRHIYDSMAYTLDVLHRKNSTYDNRCVNPWGHRLRRIIAMQNKRTGQKVTVKALFDILADQGERCALTGCKLDPNDVSADHKQPIVKGGAHAPSNIQLVLPVINQMNGTLTQERFIELCTMVAQYAKEKTPLGGL